MFQYQTKKTRAELQELSNEVLEVIDSQNEMTRSDLQAVVEALTDKIYNAGYQERCYPSYDF